MKKAVDVSAKFYPNPTYSDFAIKLSSALSETADIKLSSIGNNLVYIRENTNVPDLKLLKINLNNLGQRTYIFKIQSLS